ncbi:kelch-like protein 10 isoform X1 [Rhipicephalus microplus]|uniref:kelch-like protein 10 isoform X1 n=1 Tax=Rhipicephalus microplus TaxID=6941 RepID=UPI003F6A876B
MCATVAEVKDRAANGADKNDGMVTTSFEAAQLFIDDGRQREFSPAAAARAMPGLREQRKTRQCCDVVFRANYTVEVWAHRFVMSAKYSGCYTLFTIAKESMAPEKRKEVGCPPVRAVIKDLESGMIELLVENAYQIPLHERIGMHNIVKVLKLTEKLKLTQIRDNCLGKVKKDLEPGNCIETYHLATSHGYEFLTGEAFGYLVRSFDEVWKNNAQFEALTAEEMKTVLEDDQLNAPSEAEETFEAILKWISADAAARKEYLAKFRPLVRFVRCSVMEFEKVVSHPEVEGDERSLKVLHVIHHTLTRPSLYLGKVAGIDLSLKQWLTPRVPKDILFVFGG